MANAILAGDEGYFLVDVFIKPTNNVKVYLDGDHGITIEKCVAVNRALYKKIEETGIFPDGNFSLEVSSPGLDEPLKLHRQYVKNEGRKVEVTLTEGTRLEGVLKKVDENSIEIETETGKNRKKEVVLHTIPFDKIKTTKIQIVF